MKKALITALMMTIASANTYYDESTLAVKQEALLFPPMQKGSITLALTEMKRFAEARGTSFSYKITGKIKERPFAFSGGTLKDFCKRLEQYNLYATTSYEGLSIVTHKEYAYSMDKIVSPKKLNSMLRKNNIYAKHSNGSIKIKTTRKNEAKAKAIIQTYMSENKIIEHTEVLSKISMEQTRNIKKTLKQMKNVKIKHLEKDRIVFTSCKKDYLKIMSKLNSLAKKLERREKQDRKILASQEKMIQKVGELKHYVALPMENINISLNRPYTLRTIVKALSKKTGLPYKINFDGNIPTEKGVNIAKLQDLNAYLKRKHKPQLIQKKLKNGEIMLVNKR